MAITSEASQASIDEAEEKLRDVIELLTADSNDSDSPDSNFEACYDYAYQKYYSQLSSTNAADKASALCKGKMDMEVVKFL